MRQYEEPIDIIIILFGWYKFKEDSAPEAAKLQNEIQAFFGNLSAISKEATFVPLMNIIFQKNPLRIIQEQLKSGTPGKVGEPREKVSSYQPTIRHILDKIECQHCIKMNWVSECCSSRIVRS